MDNNTTERINIDNYLANKELLQLTYIPFDSKMEIVSHLINGVINSVGGLNTSLLRRISSEVFIESISNIDMGAVNESGLTGFDELLCKREFDSLIDVLGSEYVEFQTILNERVADYIRIETNPAVTINAIYNQVTETLNKILDYVSKQIQEADPEKIINFITENLPNNIGGDENET